MGGLRKVGDRGSGWNGGALQISGWWNVEGKAVDATEAHRLTERIAHRGPDDDGFYLNENVGLAMRRLSIIDVAHGKQPMHNQDKTAWIVFNGEIYNFQELKRDLENADTSFAGIPTPKFCRICTKNTARRLSKNCAECLRLRSGTRAANGFFWRATVSAKSRFITACSTGD